MDLAYYDSSFEDGWIREILYKVAEFVAEIVQIFEHLVPVRALNKATFSACEPPTSDLLNGGSNAWWNGSLMVVNKVVGQPTYGTLSSQTFADGKAFNIRRWSQEIAAWFPSFCDPIDEIVFIFTRWH